MAGRSTFDVLVDPGTGTVATIAAAAEAVGFDALCLGETNHDPLVLLAAASQATADIELTTSILVAFARSPMVTATAANDVQVLAGGRLRLGLGSQVRAHITRRFAMPWSRPAARMREYVHALHAIWDAWENGTRLAFDGEFYSHTLMTPMFDPGPNPYGRPPVLVAGVGAGMSRVAGEVADGFQVHSFVTEKYLTEVIGPSIDEGLAISGRTRADIEICLTPMLATGTTQDEVARAREHVRGQIAFYGSTPSYRGVLDVHGWGGVHEKLNVLAKTGEWDAMSALIDDEMLAEFAVVGTVTEAARELARRWGPLSDRIGVAAQTMDGLEAWRPALAPSSESSVM
ncbi:TIGR03617 family F420-dependent LLM class oxidoreductase (plasmid) [Rhodococcus erythropolis]|uniref:TIGR03617 family F420-dependent LLM class oxidoreductase n=1 Tax=Rhodococcus TaxID=1827 RepID=UPI0005A63EDF|nr:MULTISPECIES: TIGR03617 family F420-dependent LLM class oxidoreductase [Rhodococcus]MCJ0949788.1 TIGR03617 family F420-dependent LLM class oxidoreductase [Rhodococcus sp. ARC_M8]MDJ0441061.1 TIGR03617 family F420-dependent LLM class oxidoreductase [Rhodococcus qingshengii]QEX08329.1 TIGR03617 family F420-dependent LLM class oxidoreductase [Rhodococcus erythropolis]QOS66407.1 TIGR03617 family F420-dependent LLM class oxidoreductase [Rhodococcus qingshengii]